MHYTTLVGVALAGLVVANPFPQDLDWEAIDAAEADPIPTPSIPVFYESASATFTSYAVTAAQSSVAAEIVTDPATPVASSAPTEAARKRSFLGRRDEYPPTDASVCEANGNNKQKAGSGPVPANNTAPAYLAFPAYSWFALNASTPKGYRMDYQNLQKTSNAYGFMGWELMNSYDVAGCAAKCDAHDGCASFNIFFERTPLYDPDYNTCKNPPATSYIKCVFWGGPVTTDNAVNDGEWRANFHVVHAGSNGYTNVTVDAPSGYGPANYLGNYGDSAINAPLDCKKCDTYMGVKIFNSGPFDSRLCAQACTTQSEYNLRHPPVNGTAKTCQFFNTYLLLKNGQSVGQYCSLYSQTWDASYATNKGQTRGSDKYTISYSYSFSNATNPGAHPVCSK